jgi:hypothetical protein
MKRIVLACCFLLALSTLGPVSAASAAGWPWHRHSKDSTAAPADAGKTEKPKKAKQRREKKSEKAREQSAQKEARISPGPKTVGWWHKTPGPAGAGAY